MRAKVKMDRRKAELELLAEEEGPHAPRPPADPQGGSTSRRGVIPPPISNGLIENLSAEDAMKEYSARKEAAAKVDDAAIKQRLLDEAERCRARMQAARKSQKGD